MYWYSDIRTPKREGKGEREGGICCREQGFLGIEIDYYSKKPF